LTIPYGTVVSFLPLVAIERSIPSVGAYFTVYAVALIAARSCSGRIADRFGRATVIVPGLLAAAVGIWVIGVAYGLPLLLVGSALYGFGFGSAQPALYALTIDRVAPEARGLAM